MQEVNVSNVGESRRGCGCCLLEAVLIVLTAVTLLGVITFILTDYAARQ